MEIVTIGTIVGVMAVFQLTVLSRMEKKIDVLTKEIRKLNDK